MPKPLSCAGTAGSLHTGEAVIDDTVEAREAMLEANPPLRDWYSADDGKFTVFYLKNMQAVLYSFTGDPEILDN
ncbi:hypothetical protein [Salmonella enterica]|uniref:hypothetical protein n=1 Tax=Salmonella enterica TaxID=28901 RepID=UPI002159E9B8|nr:hypothetical protein [Salmonella enterica]